MCKIHGIVWGKVTTTNVKRSMRVNDTLQLKPNITVLGTRLPDGSFRE